MTKQRANARINSDPILCDRKSVQKMANYLPGLVIGVTRQVIFKTVNFYEAFKAYCKLFTCYMGQDLTAN